MLKKISSKISDDKQSTFDSKSQLSVISRNNKTLKFKSPTQENLPVDENKS